MDITENLGTLFETSYPRGHGTKVLTGKIKILESIQNTQPVAREKDWDRVTQRGWGAL